MEYIGSLIYDKALMEEDIRFVIYGNGMMGKRLFCFLKNNDRLERLDCFCDADDMLWGTMYEGVPIISPKKAMREKKDCHFLTAGKYAEEQVRLLQKNGIKKIHMFLEV